MSYSGGKSSDKKNGDREGLDPRGLATHLIHGPRAHVQPSNEPLTVPIYQSVKFRNSSFQDLKQVGRGSQPRYIYSRADNPTVRSLELQLADLQGCEDGLAMASGVAAISTLLLSLLKSGDHVYFFWESYKPTRQLIGDLLRRFGVTSTGLFVDQIHELEQHLQAPPNPPDQSRILIFESPTNPVLRVLPLQKITSICRKHGVLTALDNTLGGIHNHKAVGVDLYVHSLTKYLSGHGDVLGGAVLGTQELIKKIRNQAVDLGPTLDAHAAYLILRGLKTYELRWQRHGEQALAVAKWLEDHSKVSRVWYPGLASHPDHDQARQQMDGFGGVVSFELNPGLSIERFLTNLKIFSLAPSLGSTESLVAPAKMFFAGELTGERAVRAGLQDQTLRLSIGLESQKDLVGDLDQALAEL